MVDYAETMEVLNQIEEAALKFQEALAINPRDALALIVDADTSCQQGKLGSSAQISRRFVH